MCLQCNPEKSKGNHLQHLLTPTPTPTRIGKETIYGTSKVAGQLGLAKCCAARVIWSAPPLLLPPLIMSGLCKTVLKNAGPRAVAVTEVFVIGGLLLGVVPASLAVFPENDSMPGLTLNPSPSPSPNP